MDIQKQASKKETCMCFLRKNLLVLLTILGVVFGLAIGFGVRETIPSADTIMWIGLPGEMYMRMLKMMILPLIISTVITGTASLNPKSQGRISVVSISFIAIANAIPPIIGAVIMLIFNPGADVLKDDSVKTSGSQVMQTQDIFADLIRNLFPDNLITAAFQQTITKYEIKELYHVANNSNITVVKKYMGETKGTNVLGLIICCTLFGVGTTSVGRRGKAFLEFFHAAAEIILQILRWLIWFTPVGVASLIATVLADTDDLKTTFQRLGMFIVASLLGIFILMFVLIPLVYVIIIRRKPFKFFFNLIRPLMITFATASSAIAIPDTLFFMEKKNKIDIRVSRFVVPFSSALNKSGSALYIAASCVFICQLEHVETTPARVLIIIILTALSTFAVPSVPSAGIVTIIILLTSMNIPTQAVGLLLSMEWFLDRCRTAGNVYSQNLCVAVTQKFANLPPLDETSDDVDVNIFDTPEIIVDDTQNGKISLPANEPLLANEDHVHNTTCNGGAWTDK